MSVWPSTGLTVSARQTTDLSMLCAACALHLPGSDQAAGADVSIWQSIRFRPGGRRGREYPPADVGLGRLEFWPAGSQRPGFRACFSRPLTRSPGAGDGRLVAGDLSPITASYVNKRPDRTQACPRPHDGPATVSSLRPLVARQLRCAPSPPPRHATPLSRVVPAVRPSDFGRNPGITAVLDRA